MSILTNDDKISRTICGLPLNFNDIVIHPLRVKNMLDVGERLYSVYLTVIISPHKVLDSLEIKDKESLNNMEKLSSFELIMLLCRMSKEFEQTILKALHFFLSSYSVKTQWSQQCVIICDGEIEKEKLNKKNYDDFIDIIKLQNYVEYQDVEPTKKLSKKAKELLAKKRRAEEQVRKIKGNKSSNGQVSFNDYLTAISVKSHIVDFNVIANMTLYAFYHHMQTLLSVESYDLGVQQLLAGAKPKDVNLKHWLSKL